MCTCCSVCQSVTFVKCRYSHKPTSIRPLAFAFSIAYSSSVAFAFTAAVAKHGCGVGAQSAIGAVWTVRTTHFQCLVKWEHENTMKAHMPFIGTHVGTTHFQLLKRYENCETAFSSMQQRLWLRHSGGLQLVLQTNSMRATEMLDNVFNFFITSTHNTCSSAVSWSDLNLNMNVETDNRD